MPHLQVLAIQADDLCPPALIGEVLRARGIAIHLVNIDRGESLPAEPGAFDGLLILGGRQSVLDDGQQQFVLNVNNIIRSYHELERPVLGICLGAQLVATAFATRVKRVSELQFGFAELNFLTDVSEDPLLREVPDHQRVFVWHEDCSDLPEGAIHLLSTEAVANYGFRLGHNTWGFQCHPEVRLKELRAMLDRGGYLVTKHLGERGRALLDNIDTEIQEHLNSAMQFGAMIANGWADRIVQAAGDRGLATHAETRG